MSLDFPAFGQGLWNLYDQTGIRPEYVLPVLYSESGFSPSITNSIGCIGINQACPFANNLPADYASWSASQQLNGLVAPSFAALVAKYGPIRSGTKLYIGNFWPISLPNVPTLNSVVTKNARALEKNRGLDIGNKGYISAGDMAHFVAKAAATPTVQNAIAQTYALRPDESPKDPVFGDDYSSSSAWPIVAAVSFAVGGGLVAMAIHSGWRFRLFG
jgi:hypothetical protein